MNKIYDCLSYFAKLYFILIISAICIKIALFPFLSNNNGELQFIYIMIFDFICYIVYKTYNKKFAKETNP